MPRPRHRSVGFKPSVGNSLDAHGAGFPVTAEECAREMDQLGEHQRAINDRMKVITAQLHNLLAKQATSSATPKPKPAVNVVDKEDDEVKVNSLKRGDQTSKAASGSWEEEEEGDHQSVIRLNTDLQNAADDGDNAAEVASPLVTAIKKLQQRNDQKRGIRMWTKNLAKLFGVTDKDCSGHIDEQEYQQMIDMLKISEELKYDLRGKFSHIDTDGEGGITLIEFLEFFLDLPMFKEELNVKSNAPYIYKTNLSRIQYFRRWLYCVVDVPDFNIVSKMLFCIDLMLTSVPIVIFCAEGAQSSLIVTWPRDRFMWFISIFFALEYTIGLVTCRYKHKFIFDIVHTFELVSFLFWIYYNTFGNSDTLDPMGFVVFRLIRYVNIYKVCKLTALEEDLDIYVNTLQLAWTSSGAVVMLLVFTIFLFSLLIYVFERGMYNPLEKRWQRPDEYDESPFADMSSCVYFVIVTMTTLGYGDMSPKSLVGRMVAVITVLVGLCNITFLINIIGDCFEEVFRKFVIKKSREMETQRAVYVTECVNDVQAGHSWMNLSRISSSPINILKEIATGSGKEPRESKQ